MEGRKEATGAPRDRDSRLKPLQFPHHCRYRYRYCYHYRNVPYGTAPYLHKPLVRRRCPVAKLFFSSATVVSFVNDPFFPEVLVAAAAMAAKAEVGPDGVGLSLSCLVVVVVVFMLLVVRAGSGCGAADVEVD